VRLQNAMMCCLLACAACGSKKNEQDQEGAGSGAPGVGSSSTMAAGGAAASGMGSGGSAAAVVADSVATAGAVGRRTRIFECGFVKLEGEGKDRKAIFKLKSIGLRPAEGAQAWIYYYDAADKLLSRYPHRFSTKLGPGDTEEQALGQTGASIPKAAATIECEISAVTWKDKTEWTNANLSSHAIERPRGGFTHAQLLEREGERVTATWTGKVAGGPVLALENVSARPLTAKVVWIYQYDDAGKQLDRGVSNVSIDLEPGARVEQGLGPKKLKAGAKYVEAAVSEVRFRDGKQEQWLNDNLAPLGDRPMKQAPGAATRPAP
jgi:hypothetical protein